MDEAYTVGVRLALEDGVSAGIAAMTADMAALERVTAAGLVGLDRFRTLGAAMGRPAAEPARWAQAEPPVRPQEEKIEAASTTLPRRMWEPLMADPRGADAQRSVAVPTVAAPRAAAADPVGVTETAQPQTAGPQLVVQMLSPMARPDGTAVSAASARPAISATATERLASGREPWPMGVAPTAEPERASAPVAATSVLAPVASAQMGSVAPQGSIERETGPTGGDVYLDGARMGRWIAERMARAASRPQGGTTGFDGRMGPAFPGTLQGG